MKTLLVPTDFSTYSNAGIKIASQIAKKSGSSIVLLHNVYSLVNWKRLSDKEKIKHQEVKSKTDLAERKLNDLVSHDLGNELDVRTIVTHGITFSEIVFKAEALNADLIIMGSHGNEAQGREFIGSNIQKVIRFATCPVLATKKGLNNVVGKIVFPSQFDFDVHKPFAQVIKMAEVLGSEICLLYVNTPYHFKDNQTIKREMNEFCRHYPNHKFETAIYNQKDAIAGIIEFCDEVKADMIAMVTRDRRHSPKYLVGITELLICHSNIPVLSINEKIYEPVIV